MYDALRLVGLGSLFFSILIAAFVALTAVWERSRVARSVLAAGRHYRIGRPASEPGSGPAESPAPNLLSRLAGPLRPALGDLATRLTPAGVSAKLSRQLDQAGNPTWLTVAATMEYKGLFLVAGALSGLLIGCLCVNAAGTGLLTAGFAVAGFFAPNVLVQHLAEKRQQQIRRTLPDILDTLVVTVEAGLGFEAAVAHVVAQATGPVAGELARSLHEMRLGRSRIETLRELRRRTTIPELKAFSSAVIHATSLGISLGGVLRQQSMQMRLRRRQRAEEQAQKVPVKILFPVALCIFPALFVVVLGPGMVRAMASLAR